MNLRQSFLRIWLRRAVAVCSPPKVVNGSLRVLTYHRVRPDADDPRSITPERFREHLTVLKENQHVVSIDEVLTAINGEKPLPERAVLLTFDDGYADLYDYAMPLLQEFGFPAVIFMLAGYVGRVGRTYSEANYPEAPFLSATQLRDMQMAGIEIGSHGIWHVPLAHLPLEEAEKEVSRSKHILSDLLGTEIKTFSYPWGRAGDFFSEHVELVKRAGYKLAFTMLHGINKPPFQRLKMRRCHIYPWDDEQVFNAILEGRFDLWSMKNFSFLHRHSRKVRKKQPFPMNGDDGGKFGRS